MKELEQMLESISLEAIQWRRHLHENPELGFQEYDTADFIEKTLRKIGIEQISRIESTGILALIEGENKSDKCIALRADIDALPSEEKTGLPYSSKRSGVAHLCGHDIHTAVLLGAAKALWKNRKSFSGTIKLIFQPAEEILGGAKQMIQNNVLNNPKVDAVFGLHCWPDIPAGTVGVYPGAMMAGANNFKIRIEGKQGHGAHPHRSIDPIVISSEVVLSLQTLISRETAPLDPAVLSFGKIHGGTSPNIIPDAVELEGTFRTLSPQVTQTIRDGLVRIVTGIAQSLRGEASLDFSDGLPPLINDENLYQQISASFLEYFGEDNVVFLTAPSMGSEDFSLYLETTPGFFYRLGTGKADTINPPLHAQNFNPDEKSIQTGIRAMYQVAQTMLGK